mgnify:FL=1
MKKLVLAIGLAMVLSGCASQSNSWKYPQPVTVSKTDYSITASFSCTTTFGQKECTDLSVSVTNKSSEALKIDWNDSALAWGTNSSQLLPDGIRFIDATKIKPDTIVPPGMTIQKVVTPADNVYFDSMITNSWQKKLITPNNYSLYLQMKVGSQDKSETLQLPVTQ